MQQYEIFKDGGGEDGSKGGIKSDEKVGMEEGKACLWKEIGQGRTHHGRRGVGSLARWCETKACKYEACLELQTKLHSSWRMEEI